MLYSDNLELTRLALHAYNLELTLLNGQKTNFTEPLPLDLEEAVLRIAI
ncbi:MAG: hypothetical protein ACK42D_01440 [Candidatus Paceibacteria bacterium]